MNLISLEYFLIVAEEMNITRAAKRLIISQQALSNHIKRLEMEYKVQLFDRKPVFRLTNAGEQLFFYGRKILAAEQALKSSFFEMNENSRATLRVGFSRLRGSVFFPLIWNIYRPAHKYISIELIDGNTNKFDEMLRGGTIDLYVGVNVQSRPGQITHQLITENMYCCFSEETIMRCSPNSYEDLIQRFKTGVDLTDLINLPLITVRKGNKLRASIEDHFSNIGKPQFVLECDDQNLIFEASLADYGIGLLSPIPLFHNLQKKPQLPSHFHFFPIKNDHLTISVYLVYRTDYPLPSYTKDFIKDTITVFQTYSTTLENNFKTID